MTPIPIENESPNGATLGWHFFDEVKRETVAHLALDLWPAVKEACDFYFSVYTNGKSKICPAWWIGGFSR